MGRPVSYIAARATPLSGVYTISLNASRSIPTLAPFFWRSHNQPSPPTKTWVSLRLVLTGHRSASNRPDPFLASSQVGRQARKHRVCETTLMPLKGEGIPIHAYEEI